MKLVKDILNAKGSDVFSITADISVLDAANIMAERGVGSLLVMEGDTLRGIISERDYARKVTTTDKAPSSMKVGDIMSNKVLCVSPNSSVDECMAVMTDKRHRHLPVVQDKKVIGVVSIGDLVKALIHDQQILIDQLQHYIAG